MFLGISHVYRRYICYQNSVCFSPVYLSFIMGPGGGGAGGRCLNQDPRRVEGKLFFLPYKTKT